MLLKFTLAFRCLLKRSTEILRFLITAALRTPRLMLAVALLALVALASTLTYTGFLVVGVLAEYLGTGRVTAGLLLGVFLARFPRISKGKLRTVGLLPQLVRRPVIVGLPLLCMVHFLARGEYVPALFTGFAAAFLLTFPWIRRAMFGRFVASLFKSPANANRPGSTDSTVIDVEFKEKKD